MARDKKVWEPMKLTYAGDVGDVLKNAGGQGKSASAADSGDVQSRPDRAEPAALDRLVVSSPTC